MYTDELVFVALIRVISEICGQFKLRAATLYELSSALRPAWILISFLLVLAAGAADLPGRQKPNILVLVTDDQRWDSLGCTGNRIVQTPNIDRLAARGTLFRNAFVTTSICCVSRASIFSGQYERRHKIVDFNTPFTPDAFRKTYPALLKQHGYRLGFIGKYGVGNAMPTNEFDYWRGFPGQGQYFARGETNHLTHKMGEQAIAFLEGVNPLQPFCLSVSFKAPHAQDGAPREFPPDPRDESLYANVTFPVPRTTREDFFRAQPEFVKTSEGRRRWQRRFADLEMFQKTARDYFRLITGIDREIGRIMQALTTLRLAENTIVIFTSDNGFFLGERGMADKWLMHEESIRVPLIIVDPRLKSSNRRKEANAMALNIDLAPTILDYSGIPSPPTTQGRSLRSWVEGKRAVNWRKDWFYEHHSVPDKIPQSEGVRTERWKYIRYIAAQPIVEELYDLKRDSCEERNLANQRAYSRTLNRLRARWKELRNVLE